MSKHVTPAPAPIGVWQDLGVKAGVREHRCLMVEGRSPRDRRYARVYELADGTVTGTSQHGYSRRFNSVAEAKAHLGPQGIAFTVVLVPEDSRKPGRVEDIEARTFVAHVTAANHREAYAAGQNVAAESGSGPTEPIDWAVVFMCRGHLSNEAERMD